MSVKLIKFLNEHEFGKTTKRFYEIGQFANQFALQFILVEMELVTSSFAKNKPVMMLQSPVVLQDR